MIKVYFLTERDKAVTLATWKCISIMTCIASGDVRALPL